MEKKYFLKSWTILCSTAMVLSEVMASDYFNQIQSVIHIPASALHLVAGLCGVVLIVRRSTQGDQPAITTRKANQPN